MITTNGANMVKKLLKAVLIQGKKISYLVLAQHFSTGSQKAQESLTRAVYSLDSLIGPSGLLLVIFRL
jgi:hypothetical protein